MKPILPAPSTAPSKLSVVVIGRNESSRLQRCLESVLAMRRGSWELELIYVDSGSIDRSTAIAEDLGAKVIALKPERPTAALGRNAGWRIATGDIVLFLDGDTVLDENFVAEALSHFEDPQIACVWGHRRESDPKQSWYVRVLDLDWVYAPGWAEFCGGDALFRRDVLEVVGGFDETLIAGEEPEMCRRILQQGYRIFHADLAMTKHDLAIRSFGQYWRRASRAGHAYAEVSTRFSKENDRFWSAEVQRNRLRAGMLTGSILLGVAASGILHSMLPLLLMLLWFATLAVRTAWKARWKSTDRVSLLLYGIHSHLQQVPIFYGQMRYLVSTRKGERLGLVEYKRS